MCEDIPKKEKTERLIQGLSEILPEYFRIYSRLLQIAGVRTQEIRSSLLSLSDTLGYDYRVLYCHLASLAILGFLRLPLLDQFHYEKNTIRLLVQL